MVSDFRTAICQLRKHPGFSAVAVLTLALGIAANVALFSIINGVLLRPLPWPEPNNLVMLWEAKAQTGADRELVTGSEFELWRDQKHLFDQMAYWPAWPGAFDFKLSGNDGVEPIKGAFVSSGLFPMLGVRPILGRTFLPEEDARESAPTVILSQRLWQQRFGGDPKVLGRTVVIDTFRRQAYQVVGVLPSGFNYPADADIWLPTGWMGVQITAASTGHWLQVLARLAPGVSLERVTADLNQIMHSAENRLGGPRQVKTVSLLEQTIGAQTRPALLILASAVGFVLLIACANVANLLLAQGVGRAKEIGVRFALGASRWRIARQLTVESLVLAGLAGAAGCIAAAWLVDLVMRLNAGTLPRTADVTLDGRVVVFAVVTSALTGVIAGIFPALPLWRTDVIEMLKEATAGASAHRRHTRMRGALLVAEIALTVVLLSGAALMLKSFKRLQEASPGFVPENLFVASFDLTSLPDNESEFFRQLSARVRSYPGVQAVAGASRFPTAKSTQQFFSIAAEDARVLRSPVTGDWFGCTPEYFAALRVPLLGGRIFRDTDNAEAPKVALINAALARRFGGRDPIGLRITFARADGRLDPTWRQIVGIVGDTVNSGIEGQVLPEVYVPSAQWSASQTMLVVRAKSAQTPFAGALRDDVRALSKNVPLPEVVPVPRLLEQGRAPARFRTELMGAFGAIALSLTLVGIYSVMSVGVAQRTREIGVRMALGAEGRDILRLVIGQGVKLTLIGLLLGLCGAFATARVLRGLLYAVGPHDAVSFVCVAFLILAVTVVASWLPAQRATKISPLVAFKTE